MTSSAVLAATRGSPPQSAGPSVAGFWFGGSLAGIGVVGAIVWVALGWLGLMHHVDTFPRMSVPGATTVHLNADTEQVLYTEHRRGAADITATDIRVTGPSGQSIPVRSYTHDLRYDVPGDAGRVGRAVATFRSTAAGGYTVSVSVSAPAGTVAIGDDIVWDAVPHVIGAGALFLVGVGAGTALIGVTAVRRGRARRMTPETPLSIR